jgi:predicted enzyme involved in methoxymalonyl-ACP biosynthesis
MAVATRATVVTKDAQNLFIEQYVLTCRFVGRKALEVNA